MVGRDWKEREMGYGWNSRLPGSSWLSRAYAWDGVKTQTDHRGCLFSHGGSKEGRKSEMSDF